MTDKEIISYFEENYVKVRKLLDEDSKNDPENDPYRSKYKAKDILDRMRDYLNKIMDSETNFDPVKLDAMMGTVLLNLGVIHMETQELTASQDVLSEAADLMSTNSVKPEITVTLINVYNNLGILWYNREDPVKAKKYLLTAKQLYEDYKSSIGMPVEKDVNVDRPEEVVDVTLLEKYHTLTLYYLAQVYGNLKENLKSAIYCHVTLRRQLEYADYDPIDWSLNCATLSQVFAEQSGFFQSRQHLAAASKVLEEYEEKLRSNESRDEVHLAKIEQFKHRSADVARCWAKYCLHLMSSSKNRLMTDADELTEAITDMSNLKLEDDDNIYDGDLTNLVFSNLDTSRYESKITYEFLLTYSDAREVFLTCQMWINKAKEYYKLETLASDHIELIQDSSRSYSYLAFFEEDDERRAKMHKRRVDMLEDLIKEINPTYYLQYCRQLWYELGEAYSEILNIKTEKLGNLKGKPSTHALNKINKLCEKTMEHYGHLVESVKDKNGKLPEKLSPELVRPVVSAYGFIGRTSMKRIAVDKSVFLSHMKKSLESYEAVVDICTRDSDAAAMMPEEFSLCSEMAQILPIKIKRLENELNQQ